MYLILVVFRLIHHRFEICYCCRDEDCMSAAQRMLPASHHVLSAD